MQLTHLYQHINFFAVSSQLYLIGVAKITKIDKNNWAVAKIRIIGRLQRQISAAHRHLNSETVKINRYETFQSANLYHGSATNKKISTFHDIEKLLKCFSIEIQCLKQGGLNIYGQGYIKL